MIQRWLLAVSAVVPLAALVLALGPTLLGGESSEVRGAASAATEQPLPLSDQRKRTSEEVPRPSREPLKLLGDDAPSSEPDAEMADNSRCHVCHLNYAEEELAAVHARENIGCHDCHGDCDAHIADESWASGGPGTPPGIMYALERIDPACQKCHESHDVPATKVIARWHERCPEKTQPEQVVCTDCHGQHRLKPELRKAWWDKRTGKPIAPPHQKRPSGQ